MRTKTIAGARVLKTKLMAKGKVRRYTLNFEDKREFVRDAYNDPFMRYGVDRMLTMLGGEDQQPFDADQVKSQHVYQHVNGGDMVSMIEIADYYEDGSTKWELAWISADGGDCDREFGDGDLNLFFRSMEHAEGSAVVHILSMEKMDDE